MMNVGHIHFDPIIAPWGLGVMGGIALLLFALSLITKRFGSFGRAFAVTGFLLALLNPSWIEERREAVPDIAALVIDESPSQSFGKRQQRSAAMLEHLQQTLGHREDLELRIIRNPTASGLDRDTILFDALDQGLADIPHNRRAGVIFLTDGQIHDSPEHGAYGPVHGILSGHKNEIDRRIVIEESPAYGIVGQKVTVAYRVQQEGQKSAVLQKGVAQVTLTGLKDGPHIVMVPLNTTQTMTLDIEHAGQNIFEITTPETTQEITAANNKSAIVINGVRDRLKVLLVSGQPHAGGRTWRDLLKSDPGVDLVHFTILREPRKLDATPQNELSLIAFPFRELFEIKLYDFDLIVFDRYKVNRILPDHYFDNIARYVQEGGALLISSGPDFIGETSLANTALNRIFPALPQSKIFRKSFKPKVNKDGQMHPITRPLTQHGDWGSWLRQIELKPLRGHTLMSGINDHPLLIVNREKEGRVAQLASDHIFLWSRGYEGGGPSVAFLRRIVHWLMKEPELDEEALQLEIHDDKITILRPGFNESSPLITLTRPDGRQETLTLKKDTDGTWRYIVQADLLGTYSFVEKNGTQHFALVGENDPPELAAVLTSQAPLESLVDHSRGGFLWASETPKPDIRLMHDGARSYAGRDWLGLRKNNAYIVNGVKATPLFPFWLLALLVSVLSVWAWWHEGRR